MKKNKIIRGQGVIAQIEANNDISFTSKPLALKYVEDFISALDNQSVKPTIIQTLAAFLLGLNDKDFLTWCNSDHILIMGGINHINKVKERYEKLTESICMRTE